MKLEKQQSGKFAVVLALLFLAFMVTSLRAATLFESFDLRLIGPQSEYQKMMALPDEEWAKDPKFISLLKRLAPAEESWDATVLVAKHQYALASNSNRSEFEANLTSPPLPNPALNNQYLLGQIVLWTLIVLGIAGYLKFSNDRRIVNAEVMAKDSAVLVGVSGWLVLFWIGLGVLAPAINIGSLTRSFLEYEKLYPVVLGSELWLKSKNYQWFVLGAYSLFSVYAALRMRFFWDKSSLLVAKIALLFGPMVSFVVGIFIPAVLFKETVNLSAPEFYPSLIVSCFTAAVWLLYLSISKRVKATYFSTVGEHRVDENHEGNRSSVGLRSNYFAAQSSKIPTTSTTTTATKSLDATSAVLVGASSVQSISGESGHVDDVPAVESAVGTTADEEVFW